MRLDGNQHQWIIFLYFQCPCIQTSLFQPIQKRFGNDKLLQEHVVNNDKIIIIANQREQILQKANNKSLNSKEMKKWVFGSSACWKAYQ